MVFSVLSKGKQEERRDDRLTLSHPEGPRKLELMPLAGLFWRYPVTHSTRSHLEKSTVAVPSSVSGPEASLIPAKNECTASAIPSWACILGHDYLLSLQPVSWSLCGMLDSPTSSEVFVYVLHAWRGLS